MSRSKNIGWSISVDTGGTFTDVVITDDKGHFIIGKAPTTPDRIFIGLGRALENAAQEIELSLDDLLAKAELFIYGTTRATNAIVTGNIAKTAFLTTAGFPDILVLREGGKFDPHEFSKPYPQPYIPRRHTFEIEERIESTGNVYLPLNEVQAIETIAKIKAKKFEACAVSLLWATSNPAHEKRLGKLLSEELPGIPYTLSHELNPILREYRRASSVAIDASIKPLMQSHLSDLERDLRDQGYRGELLISTTIGGCMDVDSVVERPIHTVRSGPAMGPIAGRRYAQLENRNDSVLVVDTGGTTFDVSLVLENKVSITQETWIGERFTGHMLGIPAVDARSVGAGGGSIAWLDEAGLLRVGPQSAGAKPGPACYDAGGELPTVTDAALVLGYIDPEFFLGGRMKLNLELARQSVKSISSPLGISIEEAAFSIYAVSNETMINAIKDITVSEGIDPAETIIVAGGGAAGFGILPIARELKCETVIIPRTASVLSASGMQFSDIQFEHTSTMPTRSDAFDSTAVNEALEEVDSVLSRFGARLEERGFNERNTHYRVDAHYAAQVWDIAVELPAARIESDSLVQDLIEAFHTNHRRIFSVEDRASPIEFLNWTGRLSINLPTKTISADQSKKKSERITREVFFGIDDKRSTKIIRGASANVGETIEGPAIIEEATTTIVLPPDTKATLSSSGSYVVDLMTNQRTR
ncbi:MAG: hydantoinase/oxoprolinase family protein [Pseudomonadota bacterium]|nr:hydantoinase/oxoprolinase family protein [Pseudomonadota bacterium]